jgi:hypothetical protein
VSAHILNIEAPFPYLCGVSELRMYMEVILEMAHVETSASSIKTLLTSVDGRWNCGKQLLS